MAIEHHILEGGRGHSVAFTVDGPHFPDMPRLPAKVRSVAVIEAGDHDFGLAKRDARIKVIAGFLNRGGKTNRYPEGKELFFREGEPIVFTAETEAALLVDY
jgi:hypothetical protein